MSKVSRRLGWVRQLSMFHLVILTSWWTFSASTQTWKTRFPPFQSYVQSKRPNHATGDRDLKLHLPKMSFYRNNFFDFGQCCTIRLISKTTTYIHGKIFNGGSIDCGGLKSDRPLVLHHRLSPANSELVINFKQSSASVTYRLQQETWGQQHGQSPGNQPRSLWRKDYV